MKKLNKLAIDWKPFDYGFSLEMEREMFKRQSEHFYKRNIAVGDRRRSEICNTLVRLLDIILGDNHSAEHEDPVEVKILEDNTIFFDDNEDWKSVVYVNTRNAARFLEDWQLTMWDLSKPVLQEALREEKAWHLYNELRKNKMRELWN